MSLYGLIQAPRTFIEIVQAVPLQRGFIQSKIDPCISLKKDITCIVYVDDTIYAGPDASELEKVIVASLNDDHDKMKHSSQIQSTGQVRDFLGINIEKLEKEGINKIQAATECHLSNDEFHMRSVFIFGSFKWRKRCLLPSHEQTRPLDHQKRQNRGHHRRRSHRRSLHTLRHSSHEVSVSCETVIKYALACLNIVYNSDTQTKCTRDQIVPMNGLSLRHVSSMKCRHKDKLYFVNHQILHEDDKSELVLSHQLGGAWITGTISIFTPTTPGATLRTATVNGLNYQSAHLNIVYNVDTPTKFTDKIYWRPDLSNKKRQHLLCLIIMKWL